MKNFPHQINQLPRLTNALEVFARLIRDAANANDDGVVGDALARARVYTFRNEKGSVESLLNAEHRKPHGSQGTRTCARDLRRFFHLLNFIMPVAEQRLEITPLAGSLLVLHEAGAAAEMKDIWRQALWNLALEDETGCSHPYRLLMRLVAEKPGLPKPYAGLCLEARDDSEEEFARIIEIAGHANPRETMDALATAHMAKNAVKILPSIAEQLGDLREDHDFFYPSERVTAALPENATGHVSAADIQQALRQPSAPRVREPGNARRAPAASGPITRSYDPDILAGRTNAHDACLDRLCGLFPARIARLEADYDLLLLDARHALIVEAKTIRSDARIQVRLGLGQILYYEYFDVIPGFRDKTILRLVLTDRPIPEDLQAFLAAHRIGVVWLPEGGGIGGSAMGLQHLRTLGANGFGA
jgi:hypothetical protein